MIRRSASASIAPAIRRSTVLAVGGLLVGLPLITACGTPHAGAAAVVDGDQITVSSLQAKVKAVRAAEAESPDSAQLTSQSSQLTGRTLSRMLFNRVIFKTMAREHVTVTRAQLQTYRHQQEHLAGGAKALKTALLQQQSIAPGDVDDYLRADLGVQKIAAKEGIDLKTQQGGQQMTDLVAKTSKAIGVDVNPRYGKWDVSQFNVVTARDPWLAKSSASTQQA